MVRKRIQFMHTSVRTGTDHPLKLYMARNLLSLTKIIQDNSYLLIIYFTSKLIIQLTFQGIYMTLIKIMRKGG